MSTQLRRTQLRLLTQILANLLTDAKKFLVPAPFEIVPKAIAGIWRLSALARNAVILDLKRRSRIIPDSLDKIVRHDI